jgi:competence protein ComEA
MQHLKKFFSNWRAPLFAGACVVLVSATLSSFGADVKVTTTGPDSKRTATTTTSTTVKTEKVDVNSADVKTLQALPGVGPVIANRIVDGRPYRKLSDLEKVDGLSHTKVSALRSKVTFGPELAATKDTPRRDATTKAATTRKTETISTTTPAPATETRAATVRRETTLPQPPTPTGSATGKLAPGQRININTATKEELDTLPGIGPVRAQAIIDYRTEHGNFKTIEEIENVKGIKSVEFSKVKDNIRVR